MATDHLREIPHVRQLEREERRDASRYVLRKARDREDLRELLDALGLNTTTNTAKGDRP